MENNKRLSKEQKRKEDCQIEAVVRLNRLKARDQKKHPQPNQPNKMHPLIVAFYRMTQVLKKLFKK